MPTRKTVQQNWHERESGLIVPEGTTADLSYWPSANAFSQIYLQIKEKAFAIEQLYADSNIPLPSTSNLARLVAEAKALPAAWFNPQVDNISKTMLCYVSNLDRIADAVLPLRRVPDRTTYLTALTSGSLNCLERQQSKAKDILWELELWSILQRRSFNAVLAEPPDIVVTFEDAKIGIACKKFYSAKNVEKVLSQAVAQIEASFDFGIVAVNLDDLRPPNQILQFSTQEEMRQFVKDFNRQFLGSHKRHFRKYLASGRLLSALVSTRVLADVYYCAHGFNPGRQSTFWTIPGLLPEKERQLKRFYNQFMG
jgi:hypothetical protein